MSGLNLPFIHEEMFGTISDNGPENYMAQLSEFSASDMKTMDELFGPIADDNVESISADINVTGVAKNDFEDPHSSYLNADSIIEYDIYENLMYPYDRNGWQAAYTEESLVMAEESKNDIAQQIDNNIQARLLECKEQARQAKDMATTLEHKDSQIHAAYFENVGGNENLQGVAMVSASEVIGADFNIDHGSQAIDELLSIDGILTESANENSYDVPEEQSEDGLAGLFGLTLDQVKSGMRNKKASVSDTVVEAPKPAANPTPLPVAGVKKSKTPKLKVTTSTAHIQAEEHKSHPEATASLVEQQSNASSSIADPVKPTLPPWITQAHFDELNKVAKDAAYIIYGKNLKSLMDNVKAEFDKKHETEASQSPGQHGSHNMLQNALQSQQQALQNGQAMHMNNATSHSQQNPVQQAVNHVSLISGHHAAPNCQQQQITYMKLNGSPMKGNQMSAYNTPQNTFANPYYPAVQGNQDGFYPSPMGTPLVQNGSSYGSPMVAGQFMANLSPNGNQNNFNMAQQGPQMGMYANAQQQPWQLVQQGSQVQQPFFGPPMQYAAQQQQAMYYTPAPAQQQHANGYFPQYDPQNQGQQAATGEQNPNRMRQVHQVQQQSGMQFQSAAAANNHSSAMMMGGGANGLKRKLSVADFPSKRRK